MTDRGHKVTIGNLPFTPIRGQVIYVDSDNNKRINAFIVSNYDWLRSMFREKGLDFCYLPLLGEELISYHAPYLSDKQRQDLLQSVPSIASLIEVQSPSLLYALDDEGDGELRLLPINARWYNKLDKVFTTLADSIRKNLASHYTTQQPEDVVSEPTIRYSLSEESPDIKQSKGVTKGPNVRFSIGRRDDYADYRFDAESETLIREIKERIEALRDKGVNSMIIHTIIDEGERLSSLLITKDYRIFLPEYQNREIIMPALPKAVFILFLKHPEGIRFKDLADYHDELLGIYRALNPIGGTKRQLQSIQAVTNPMSNSINEKCAQIREAFIKNFDDSLAKNYYITGKKGEPKRIALAPSLVVWEQ
ncbi:MAG: hypothetical protein IKW85_04860 [Muribaculaceae bacterium]|nr:hypothetical protein [Muribaculaceae bacterium]